MQTTVEIANLLGAAGTLAIAWLVYQFSKQQAAQNDARAERQLHLDQQNLRLSLLERRLNVLSQVREVWAEYALNAHATSEMLQKLYPAIREAGLLYDDDLLDDLTVVAQQLAKLERTFIRLEQARGNDDRYQKLLENQFKAEDKLWPVLDPLMEKMRTATRIQELRR
ncbi:MAG: hypothetical protein QOH47_776 [Sphingomonadales bacterium]|jgi:hypothetical protein|nr:hypothetical protein [Sphingomonadales bacterium]